VDTIFERFLTVAFLAIYSGLAHSAALYRIDPTRFHTRLGPYIFPSNLQDDCYPCIELPNHTAKQGRDATARKQYTKA